MPLTILDEGEITVAIIVFDADTKFTWPQNGDPRVDLGGREGYRSPWVLPQV